MDSTVTLETSFIFYQTLLEGDRWLLLMGVTHAPVSGPLLHCLLSKDTVWLKIILIREK